MILEHLSPFSRLNDSARLLRVIEEDISPFFDPSVGSSTLGRLPHLSLQRTVGLQEILTHQVPLPRLHQGPTSYETVNRDLRRVLAAGFTWVPLPKGQVIFTCCCKASSPQADFGVQPARAGGVFDVAGHGALGAGVHAVVCPGYLVYLVYRLRPEAVALCVVDLVVMWRKTFIGGSGWCGWSWGGLRRQVTT